MATTRIDNACRAAIVNCEIEIGAGAKQCYHSFFDGIGDWFYEDEETRKSRPSRIEEQLGGRFYIEEPETGNQNLLAIVTMLKPNRAIRLRGDFTIPQAFVANVMIRFEAIDDARTRVTIEHRMAGEFDEDLPAGFDEGWMDGLEKLKVLIEGP